MDVIRWMIGERAPVAVTAHGSRKFIDDDSDIPDTMEVLFEFQSGTIIKFSVNEACGAGLPVIATRSTGAAQDLVRDGWNGFLLERDDREALVHAMTTLARDASLRRAFGARSRSVADGLTLDVGARRFKEAVEMGVRRQTGRR